MKRLSIPRLLLVIFILLLLLSSGGLGVGYSMGAFDDYLRPKPMDLSLALGSERERLYAGGQLQRHINASTILSPYMGPQLGQLHLAPVRNAVESARLLVRNEVDLAWVEPRALQIAQDLEGQEAGHPAAPRIVAEVGQRTGALLVPQDVKIENLSDLGGRRIGIPQSHAQDIEILEPLLALNDLGLRDAEAPTEFDPYGPPDSKFVTVFYESREALVDAYLAGQIDGVFLVAAHPSPTLTHICNRKASRLVPLSVEFDRLADIRPDLREQSILGRAYPALTHGGDTASIGTPLLLMASPEIHPLDIKTLTRRLLDGASRLAEVVTFFELGPVAARGHFPEGKMHPGALLAYQGLGQPKYSLESIKNWVTWPDLDAHAALVLGHEEREHLALAVSSPGHDAFDVGMHFAQHFNGACDVGEDCFKSPEGQAPALTVLAESDDRATLNALLKDKVDFALVRADHFYAALDNPDLNFAAQVEGLRLVGTPYIHALTVLARQDSGNISARLFVEADENWTSLPETVMALRKDLEFSQIDTRPDPIEQALNRQALSSLRDIEGLRMSMHTKESATFRDNAVTLFRPASFIHELWAMNIFSEEAYPLQAVALYNSGIVDGLALGLAHPSPWLEEQLRFADETILLPISELERWVANREDLVHTVIDSRLYDGIDEDIPTIGVPVLWLTKKEMADESILEVLNLLLDPEGALHEKIPQLSVFSVGNMSRFRPLPFHQAAANRYDPTGELERVKSQTETMIDAAIEAVSP